MPRKIKPIRYINQGMESARKIELLLSLTKLRNNESMVMAIEDYFIRGFDISDAALINNVRQSNLSRSIENLNEVATKVELINELRFISVK